MVPSRNLLHWGIAGGRTLCEPVGRLVATGPTMCCNPLDGDVVVSCEDVWAGLDGRRCEVLAGAKSITPHSVDCRGGVDEHRVPVPALLLLVKGAEGLVDGNGPHVEGLLVGAKVVAASGPPPSLLGPQDISCSYPSAVLL